MPWSLLAAASGQTAKTYSLTDGGPFVVGRSADCQVRLETEGVSRRHCQLTLLDGEWTVEDLGSHNGTYINGERVTKAKLLHGDRLTLGSVTAHVQPEGDDAPTGSFPPPRPRKAIASARADDDSPDLEVYGDRFHRRHQLHAGATGTFHAAWDDRHDRLVCLQLVSRQVATDESQLQRFVRGAKAAFDLRHPNIVEVYQAGRSSGQWWLAMELMTGPSLRQLALEVGIGNALPQLTVYRCALDVVSALTAAAEHQILHRNIKPDTVLFTSDDVAKLNNFTLARAIRPRSDDQITAPGEVVTDSVADLAYMAPEQLDPNATLDVRCDIYGLGACVYTALTGRPPLTGNSLPDMLKRVRTEVPPPPSKYALGVSGPLEGIVMKCLSKSPTDRYASPQDLDRELRRAGKYQGLWA